MLGSARHHDLCRISVVGIFALVLIVSGDLFAQEKTKTVVAGERYASAPGGQEWILGKGYRDLWVTPIEVEVLDLETFAGGLIPVMRVGGMQTLGLALKGQNGRDYTFRGVDKDLTHVVPDEFRGTGVEDIAQDQIAAGVPGADVIVPPIAQAVGVLHVVPKLVVMPDDPLLGEFRNDFANVLGSFMEFPGAVSDTNPGFQGATEIIGHPEIWTRLHAGPEDRVDTRAFLRARLLDILLGDWDRHRKQWRWAKIPGKSGWQPIPEDRDQVFSDYEGFALDMARLSAGAQMVTFEEDYPPLGRLTQNGWDVDRFLLTDIEKAEWMEIARQVQAKVSDQVIDRGLRRMPPEYYELRGPGLEKILRSRRNKLTEVAEDYYHHLASFVDIQGTSKKENLEIERFKGGAVEVRIGLIDDEGSLVEPYYRRRFQSDETKEVRIYLHGGNDAVSTLGEKGSPIKVRVMGGRGNDVVDDSQGGGVDFYDFQGDNRVVGDSGTDTHARHYEMPENIEEEDEVPYVPPRDWGRSTKPLLVVGYHGDPGLTLGAGFDTSKYAFRKYPYGNRHILKGGFGLNAKKPFVDYKGDFRRQNSWFNFAVHTRFSGLEQLRYYGLGNETKQDQASEVYQISDFQFTFFPAMSITRGAKGELMFGPIAKYSDTSGTEPDTILEQEQPYGTGKFGEAGLQTRFRYDSRDPKDVMSGGIEVEAIGSYYFEAWDVESAFGSLEGELGGHIPLAEPLMLTLFVGGKTNWGDYPFYEAAYIGGHHTTDGYHWNRFAGDSSLYGRLDLKWAFMKIRNGIPGELGLSLRLNAGRVWLEGEDSNVWHDSVGASLFYAPFNRLMLYELGFGTSDEGTFWIFKGKMSFLKF